MGEFLFETQNAGTYLICRLQEEDRLDAFSLGMVTNNRIPGLLQTLFTQRNEERRFLYHVTAKVSLRQFLSGGVTRLQCVRVLKGIADAILAAGEYMLSAAVLLLEEEYIFINVGTGDVFLVCLPLDDRPEPIDLQPYFRRLLSEMRFSETESVEYPARIFNALNREGAFSLPEFTRFLTELEREKEECGKARAADSLPQQEEAADAAAPSRRLHSARSREPEKGSALERTQGSVQGSVHKSVWGVGQEQAGRGGWLQKLLGRKDAPQGNGHKNRGRLERSEGFAIPGAERTAVDERASCWPAFNEADFGVTTELAEEVAAEETMLLRPGDGMDERAVPYLIRQKTQEKIPIEGSVFKIGKEKSYVDYFIGDNPTISRSHADILRRGNDYYVMDTHSTNHTLLNGRLLQGSEEALLEDHATLCFGSEEFIFLRR